MGAGVGLTVANALCLVMILTHHVWSELDVGGIMPESGRLANYLDRLWNSTTQEPKVVDESKCLFPFWWGGEFHSNCTRKDRSNYWCATEVEEGAVPLKSAYCKSFLVGPMPSKAPPTVYEEYMVKNPCKMPFFYNNKTFYGCTWEDSPRPWCPVKVDQIRRPTKVKFCHELFNDTYLRASDADLKHMAEGHFVEGHTYTVHGELCLFPFRYENQVFMNCHCEKTPCWCPFTLTDHRDPLDTDYCSENDTILPHQHKINVTGVVETLFSGPCAFPFMYKGVLYTDCACVDAPACWCAVSLTVANEPSVSDYCVDNLEGDPPSRPPPSYAPDHDFTIDGWACHFPFNYHNRTYYKCTLSDIGRLFCATLVDENGNIILWNFC